MESEREEDWDLASILISSDIWAPSSAPDRLPVPRRRRPPSPCLPSCPSCLLHPRPDSPQLFIRHHEDNPLSVDMTAVTSPSIEWRIESPPHETVASLTVVEAPDVADEDDRRQKPGEVQENAAETEEEERRRREEGEKEAAATTQKGGRVYEWGKRLLPISLWQKIGPEMAEKLDMAKEDREAHVLMLQNLTEREEMDRQRRTSQRWKVRRQKEEMYGTVQMYSLLQGVIYAAVADASSSIFDCTHFRWVVSILILVTVAAAIGICVKYVCLGRETRLLHTMNSILVELRSVTNQLKDYVLEAGAGEQVIDLEKLSERIPKSLYLVTGDEQDHDEDPDERPVWPSWRFTLAGLLSLSVAFVVAITIRQMLCTSCPPPCSA